MNLRTRHLRKPVLDFERFESCHALKIGVLTDDNGIAFDSRCSDPKIVIGETECRQIKGAPPGAILRAEPHENRGLQIRIDLRDGR